MSFFFVVKGEFFMKWLYVTVSTLVVVLGISASVYFGAQPRTVPLIKLSYFNEPEKIAEAIVSIAGLKIMEAPVLFLGVHPHSETDMKIWKAFLDKNSHPGLKYDVVVMDPNLPYKNMIAANSEIDIKDDRPRFIEGLKAAQEKNLRIAIIVPTIYSSQLIKQNPVDLLKAEGQFKPVSMSLVPFKLYADEKENPIYPCIVERDVEGTGPLGCAIQIKERSLRVKKEKAHDWAGMMDLVGENDYLVFVQKVKE